MRKIAALYEQGQLQSALETALQALEQSPDSAALHNVIGAAQSDLGNLDLAIDSLTTAIGLDPNNAQAHYNLGNAYRSTGTLDKAIKSYGIALRISPEFWQAHNNIGQCRLLLGDSGMALRHFRDVVRLQPKNSEILHSLGRSCEETGQVDQARVCYTQLLKTRNRIDPLDLLNALVRLPGCSPSIDIAALLKTIKPVAGQGAAAFNSKRQFIEAQLAHREGRHREAWQHLLEANRPMHARYGARFNHDMKINVAVEEGVRAQRDRLTERRPDEPGQPVSLFILGPSRGGKSTVEKLAGSLPGVSCGYENAMFENIIEQAFAKAGVPQRQRLAHLPTDINEWIRQTYFEKITERVGPSGVFTSTSPINIKNVARAAQTIPNSRFVFVKRNLDDITLRIFMSQYHGRNSYAYDIASMRKYLVWYYAMIDLFTDIYADISMVIDYEQTVESPKETRRALTAFLGIQATDAPVPNLGDDRGCGLPYIKWIEEELVRTDK